LGLALEMIGRTDRDRGTEPRLVRSFEVRLLDPEDQQAENWRKRCQARVERGEIAADVPVRK
jgi:hypothetical protein